MSSIIFLVFEGEKTEPQILENLKQHYTFKNAVIYASFKADIYQLWNQVKDDSGLELIEIIKERIGNEHLAEISRHQVSQIFLFFDYDGHATKASDEIIEKMLAHFDNETENGKLYISYPMVEALRHLKNNVNFQDTTVSAKNVIKCPETGVNYKELVNNSTSYFHVKKFSKENWNFIILKNFKKANLIVNDLWTRPEYQKTTSELGQSQIFNNQLQKYIKPQEHVAVLSAFPFFIVEYFGESQYPQDLAIISL